MQIPANTIYPRSGDRETVYLKAVVTDPNISVGEHTIYNDFVRDPTGFERNNVLYHYPINGDRLVIGKFCSVACGAKFLFTSANHTLQSLSKARVRAGSRSCSRKLPFVRSPPSAGQIFSS